MSSTIVVQNIYLNNTMSSYIQGLTDFLTTEYFGRTKEVVISTYEKAIEHYKNRQQNAGEKHKPKFPFLSIDPSLDFEPDDTVGRFLYNYPSFDLVNAANMYNPRIYDEGGVYIAPVLNRYRGNISITGWFSSVYELIDMRFQTIQFFGGYNRPIVPSEISAYFVLPDEYLLYNYDNIYTGESYPLNWKNTSAEYRLVKNINQNKMCWPYKVTPYIKLTGISDGSERYGGSGDILSDYRLTIDLEWDCAIPTHFILVSTVLPEPCHYFQLDVNLGYHYVRASKDATTRFTAPMEVMSTILDNQDSTSLYRIEMIHSGESYNYFLTDDDILKITDKSTDPIIITIPNGNITDCSLLRIYGKYGMLNRDFNWKLNSKDTVYVLPFSLNGLVSGDILSLEIYNQTNRISV
jgi:hypothetical protein